MIPMVEMTAKLKNRNDRIDTMKPISLNDFLFLIASIISPFLVSITDPETSHFTDRFRSFFH